MSSLQKKFEIMFNSNTHNHHSIIIYTSLHSTDPKSVFRPRLFDVVVRRRVFQQCILKPFRRCYLRCVRRYKNRCYKRVRKCVISRRRVCRRCVRTTFKRCFKRFYKVICLKRLFSKTKCGLFPRH